MQQSNFYSAARSRPRSVAGILVLLFLISIINFLDRYMFGALLPAIKTELRLSDAELGFMASTAFSILYAVMGLPLGWLADRTSPRRVISGAMAFWSLMTAVCGLAVGFGQLFLARVLVGVGEAGATPAANAIMAGLVPAHQRARAISIFALGLPAGLFVAFLGGGVMTQALGWRATLLAFALPGLVLSVVVLLFLPEPDAPPLRSRRFVASEVRLLLSRGSFRHLCLGSALFTLAWQGMITWLPSYFLRAYGLSGAEVGGKLALVLAGSQAIGLIVGGQGADATAKCDARWPLWICAAASALPVPLYGFLFGAGQSANTSFIITFVAFTLGLLQGAPALSSVHAVTPVESRGLAIAIYLMIVNIIAGFGALLIGLISDHLTRTNGPASLGPAMLWVAIPFSLWSALHFWLASRRLVADRNQFAVDEPAVASSLPAAADKRF